MTYEWELVYHCDENNEDDPPGRYRHELAYDGERIYILGGGTSLVAFTLTKIPAFNLKTNTWSMVQTKPDPIHSVPDQREIYPAARKCHACVQIDTTEGPEVVIIGGYDSTYYSDIWKLNLRTFEWRLFARMNTLRPIFFHDATATRSGCVYIYGGITCNTQSNSIRRTSSLFKMWMTIPKLSEMCVEALKFYAPHLKKSSPEELRNLGVPPPFVDRLTELRNTNENIPHECNKQKLIFAMATKDNIVEDLVKELKSVTLENGDSAIPILAKISAADPKTYEDVDLSEVLISLLASGSNSDEIRTQVAKCIADVAKTPNQRKRFTTKTTIEPLLKFISEANKVEKMNLVTQACRALGNICYLNDDARDIVVELKGDATLVNLLEVVAPTGDAENAAFQQFIKVRCGVLSNFLLGGEDYAKKAMDLAVMDKLEITVETASRQTPLPEDLLLSTLPALSILTENVSDLNFSTSLNRSLVHVLAASTNPDLAEMCLELLHYQAENDDVKLLLAKDGLCETIYSLLEKYKNYVSNSSDARALMKYACDLIVLILAGDDSMNYLYATPLLANMEAWLDESDIDLLTTGVLALGNFARTDSHCIEIVKSNVMPKLLTILRKNNTPTDDMRLQHALLSTLRNLVIPKVNKMAVIEAGLVTILLPMLEIHQPLVVFKLLGTLRMTVDGQEKLAHELLADEKLIRQLVVWSSSTDYAGISGESLRLMAWLIKHAYGIHRRDPEASAGVSDHTNLRKFVQIPGTVDSMVEMLKSQHLVMQNESLIALSILLIVFSGKNDADTVNLEELLVTAKVGEKLAQLITTRADTMTKEIVENLQSLVCLLRKSDTLVTHMMEHNIDELVKSIPILVEYCTL
ncbi:rap1 GTPase-GDP dissociation stimulator 1 [Sergentomyia squamirostris]